MLSMILKKTKIVFTEIKTFIKWQQRFKSDICNIPTIKMIKMFLSSNDPKRIVKKTFDCRKIDWLYNETTKEDKNDENVQIEWIV